MNDIKIGRRVFLGGTGLLAAAAINLTGARLGYADQRADRFSAQQTLRARRGVKRIE